MTNKKIYILDDERDILEILQLHLTEKGWNVEIGQDPEIALQHLKNRDIFLLITDLAMPKLTGEEVVDMIKPIRPDLQIVIMTGFGYDSSHSLLNLHGKMKIPVLLKPFQLSEGRIEEAVKNAWSCFSRGVRDAF